MNAHVHPALAAALNPFAQFARMPQELHMTQTTTEQLVDQLIAAKADEARATKNRVSIEEQLIERLGAKTEGATTTDLANGMKVTITGKQSYKADMPLLLQLAGNLPENLRPLKTEIKLDETGAKYLRNNEPEVWAMLAPAITVKPAKTAVEIRA